MLRDIGFWNIKGEYIEDYQEVGDEEMAFSINDINNLQAENSRYKTYLSNEIAINSELSEKNQKLRTALLKIKEVCENQDLYRGRQALASRLLQVIKNLEEIL